MATSIISTTYYLALDKSLFIILIQLANDRTMLGISLIFLIIASCSVLPATNMQEQQQQLLYAQINHNQNLSKPVLKGFPVPLGSHPHDIAPLANGGIVWYTAQASGKLGQLDPKTGNTHEIALGQGSAPHGVIIGPDGAPWITDGGLNAIVRVDPLNKKVQVFPYLKTVVVTLT